MLKLIDVNEQNWLDISRLSVREDQRGYLDNALGIIARGYVYRACRARVIGIADDETIIGVALVKDLDEEPACYDLQQFMIGRRYQGKGYGKQALELLLKMIFEELDGKEFLYSCFEENTKSQKLCEALGFEYKYSKQCERKWDGLKYTARYYSKKSAE